MTRRKSHFWNLHWVPCGHDDATIRRVYLDAFYDLLELIDAFAVVVVVTCSVSGTWMRMISSELTAKGRSRTLTEMSPLESVNWTQIANFTILEPRRIEELASAVPIPDTNVLCLQQLRICRALDKPQQLLSYCAPENSLCRQQRELIAEIESHLSSEKTYGANASSITASHS